MATKRDSLKLALTSLIETGDLLYLRTLLDQEYVSKDVLEKLKKKKLPEFDENYEKWYSESLAVIKQILPDRQEDFTKLYKDDRRKNIDYLTYTMSDYLIGLRTSRSGSTIVDAKAAIPKLKQQINILKSTEKRFESKLFDILHILQADMFDNELSQARELLKSQYIRASGAIVGVVLEQHLKQVCKDNSITIKKKNPSINDYNEKLKEHSVIEIPNWRFIQHLADLRNLCDHSKDKEPIKEEIEGLIDGVDKICKTVF